MQNLFLEEIGDGSKNSNIKKNILTFFVENGNATITELSKELALSIPTTTKFLNEMCEKGLLDEFGKLETAEGRRPNLYGLNPTSGYFLGVDVKKFTFDMGIMNFNGDLVERRSGVEHHADNNAEGLEHLCKLVLDFIDDTDIPHEKIFNANFNLSGRVNHETGYCYSMFNFSEDPLNKILSERLNMPVTIENDSRAMTYGEFCKGGVKGEKNVLFINVSWGLGMGIITDGKLHYGKSGFSGEIGHVHMFDNEVLCRCGKKGCLETEVSGCALHDIVLERIRNGESSLLSKAVNDKQELTLSDIIEATNNEDTLCIDVVEQIGIKLGKYISGLINVFNPELIIIGGAMSLTGAYLIEPIRAAVRKYSLNLASKDTMVTLSKLKDKAGVIGACMLARNNVLGL